MTDLCGIPDELLLAVANCLRDDTSNGYSDLNHLALSCRKLRPIAQEVLYMDISINPPYKVFSTRIPVNPACKRDLAHLARTLLQRPDLANRVRKLRIKLTDGPIAHLESCTSSGHYHQGGGEECTCGIPELGTQFIGFASTVESRNGVALHNDGWEDMLMRGEDTALVRIILCITPALNNLTLTTWDVPGDGEYDNIAWFEIAGVFEDIARHMDLADCFQGLSSLTRLLTNGYPPSIWLSLPRLEAAKINLFEDPMGRPNYDKSLHIAPGTTVSTTLTRLVIQPEFEALYSYHATHMDGMYGHMRSVVRGLTNLTHLFILYRSILDSYVDFDPPNTPQGSFAHIVAHLESRSLTDLTLDVEPALRNLVMYTTMLGYIHDTFPISTFTGLPRLRNVNAPQAAFISVNEEEYQACHLPTTIESIGIIDSTYETKRYLKHLLDRQTEWPYLKTIKLGESPYNDQSVHPDESDDDASESNAGERRKVSEVDDSIYEQARSRGLRVEKVQDRTAWKKGWEGLGL